MHGCAGRDTFGSEHRGRAQRAAIDFAHDLDKGVIRLAHAQYRDAARRLACETLAGQHRAGPGRRERVSEFGILDEGQVVGAGTVDRTDAGQAAGQIRSRTWLRPGQRSDLRHAQTRRARKKTELGQCPYSRPLPR